MRGSKRRRVHGSLPNGGKRGRPSDPVLDDLRQHLLSHRSERTRARFKAAVERLRALGASVEHVAQVVSDAHRPNGSLNVNLLLRYAEYETWRRLGGGVR